MIFCFKYSIQLSLSSARRPPERSFSLDIRITYLCLCVRDTLFSFVERLFLFLKKRKGKASCRSSQPRAYLDGELVLPIFVHYHCPIQGSRDLSAPLTAYGACRGVALTNSEDFWDGILYTLHSIQISCTNIDTDAASVLPSSSLNSILHLGLH